MNLAGHYTFGVIGFSVVERDGVWWATFPGLDDLGAQLVPAGDAWSVVGGPADGATVTFDASGGSMGGIVPFHRSEDPIPPIPGFGLEPPAYESQPARDEQFARLWESASNHPDWTLDAPKHDFLTWLERTGDYVFHGSNRSNITTFRTERESVELDDVAGRGNLQAVYATIRPLWAWYFAVVDRKRLRGSLRNGVSEFLDFQGNRHPRYYLSLATQDLARRPFTNGAIYVFDRSRFAPIPLYPGGPPSPEWACFEPVEPVGRIAVTPEEYPLLDRIGGHDESTRIDYGEAAEQIYELAAGVVALDPELVVELRAAPPAELWERYVRLGRLTHPDTDRTLDGLRLRIVGPPEYRAALGRRLGVAGEDPATPI